MQRLILITGVMAAGKSTVAQRLAERLPRAVHLRGDAFRRMIVSGRVDMGEGAPPEACKQLELRYRLTTDAARSYYEAGFSVIVQDNYYGPAFGRMARMLSGLPVEAVVLCPSLEAVVAREAGRAKKGYAHYDPAPLYDAFLRETPRAGLWIDSTHLTADETARRILEQARPTPLSDFPAP